MQNFPDQRDKETQICGERGEGGTEQNRNRNNTLLKEGFKKREAFITGVILNLFSSFVFPLMLFEESGVISYPAIKSEQGQREGKEFLPFTSYAWNF